jgi:hypothetical protein
MDRLPYGFDHNRELPRLRRRTGWEGADKRYGLHPCNDVNDSRRAFNKTVPTDLLIVHDTRTGRTDRDAVDSVAWHRPQA